jgi:hypothetical protein
MSFIDEIHESKFSLLIIWEKEYFQKIVEMARSMKPNCRITYVCLSRPYLDIANELKKNNVDLNGFFFIDILSSHYTKQKQIKNCIFLNEPVGVEDIKKAIKRSYSEGHCTIIFDTISTLLVFEENFSVVKFAHDLMTEERETDTRAVYIVLKDNLKNGQTELVKDLSMLVDKTIHA